jgi:hypothetical protein
MQSTAVKHGLALPVTLRCVPRPLLPPAALPPAAAMVISLCTQKKVQPSVCRQEPLPSQNHTGTTGSFNTRKHLKWPSVFCSFDPNGLCVLFALLVFV